jgi:hypothetical protein
MTVSRWILLRMRNVSDKSCRENEITRFALSNFFRKSCRLLDNVEKYGAARQATGDNTIRGMCFACWITEATDTHSQCVIIIAFPQQHWLRECTSVLMLYVHHVSWSPLQRQTSLFSVGLARFSLQYFRLLLIANFFSSELYSSLFSWVFASLRPVWRHKYVSSPSFPHGRSVPTQYWFIFAAGSCGSTIMASVRISCSPKRRRRYHGAARLLTACGFVFPLCELGFGAV